MSPSESAAARRHAVRELESEFGTLIRRHRQAISEHAQKLSPGMLPGTYKIFTIIVRREPVTASALAEELIADKAFISRAVRELEELGLIRREPDPTDRRSALLFVTDEGRARLDAALDGSGVMARTLEHWQVTDIRELSRLLRALIERRAPDER